MIISLEKKKAWKRINKTWLWYKCGYVDPRSIIIIITLKIFGRLVYQNIARSSIFSMGDVIYISKSRWVRLSLVTVHQAVARSLLGSILLHLKVYSHFKHAHHPHTKIACQFTILLMFRNLWSGVFVRHAVFITYM